MKMPARPPDVDALRNHITDPQRLEKILQVSSELAHTRSYYHWDELRHHATPAGLTREEWWLALKIHRRGMFKTIPLYDTHAKPFHFGITDDLFEHLHLIDHTMGTVRAEIPNPLTTHESKSPYTFRALMEEAITSSQLEGAATTRVIAKELLRSGRAPHTTDERMILNNFLTMQRIATWKELPLSPALVFEIHRFVTDQTLDPPHASGRLRTTDEHRIVGDAYGETFHDPPPAHELTARLAALCDFANGKTPGYFLHPVLRAIILHFWLAYDHPFVDGNGRTARALFYWSLLRAGYWRCEFISISTILRTAPTQYGLSFLHTETDENDLTYFIQHQINVMLRAIHELDKFIERETTAIAALAAESKTLQRLNARQAALIRHALSHPNYQYTIAEHRRCHSVVYQTARTDLLELHQRRLLTQKHRGKKMIFSPPHDLSTRLRRHKR